MEARKASSEAKRVDAVSPAPTISSSPPPALVHAVGRGRAVAAVSPAGGGHVEKSDDVSSRTSVVRAVGRGSVIKPSAPSIPLAGVNPGESEVPEARDSGRRPLSWRASTKTGVSESEERKVDATTVQTSTRPPLTRTKSATPLSNEDTSFLLQPRPSEKRASVLTKAATPPGRRSQRSSVLDADVLSGIEDETETSESKKSPALLRKGSQEKSSLLKGGDSPSVERNRGIYVLC